MTQPDRRSQGATNLFTMTNSERHEPFRHRRHLSWLSTARRRWAWPVALVWSLSACGGGAVVGDAGTGGGACTAGAASALAANGRPDVRPLAASAVDGEIVLQLRPGHDIASVASASGLTLRARFGQRPIWRAGVDGRGVDATLALLASDVRVLYAEPNRIGETPEGRRCSVWTIGQADAVRTQWAPQALRLAQAQALSTGRGVRVAVLDTGIDAGHPALAGRIASQLDRDFVDDDDDPSEVGTPADAGYGHGTHVAGLVLLAAPEADLVPLRVLDRSGAGNVWVLAEALAHAVDPDRDPSTDDGAHVINMSLGTLQPTRLLDIAVRLAACDVVDDDDEDDFADPGFDADRQRCIGRRGALVVAAAGNSGSDSERQYPAAEASTVIGALAVTASTEARQLASFANRGSWVQIAAPGEGITSTVPGAGHGVWSGTSMAAPLTAGVAALLLGVPAPDPQTFSGLRAWTPRDLAQRVRDRSAALCAGTPLRQVDAAAAVSNASGLDPICN